MYHVQGYVAPARDMSAPNTAPWLGDGSDLLELVERRKIDTVIVSSSMECWNHYLQSLITVRNRGIENVDLATVCERFLNRIPCDQITELWLLWGLMGRSSLYVTKLKRLVDIAIAIALLVPAAPIMLLAAFAIRASGKGPIFYTHYDYAASHEQTRQKLEEPSSRNKGRITRRHSNRAF